MKSPPVLPRSEQTRKTEQQQATVESGDCRIRNVGDFFFFLIKRLISWNPDFFFLLTQG